MFINLIFVILGLAGLYFGGEWLVQGASRIAHSFGISTLIIGLTIVAFGTSMPEMMVSVGAALNGNSDISVGNIVGSNIANIGLILGVAGMIYPISVHIDFLRREIPIMIGVSVVAYLMMRDLSLGRLDGIVLFAGFLAFTGLMIYLAQRDRKKGDLAVEEAKVEQEEGEAPILPSQRGRELLRILLGLVVLIIGAQLTIEGAVNIAREFGVSELVIGLTLVAVGTSLPELATSVIAALRKQSDIAIGNVVGSNIFNILSILGITSIIQPIKVNQSIADLEGLIMIGFAVLLLPLVWDQILQRRQGILLLVLYAVFTIYVVVNGQGNIPAV